MSGRKRRQKKRARGRGGDPPPAARRRRLAGVPGVLVLGLAGLVVAVLAGELLVRLACGDKFGPRPGFYVADKKLGWRPAPGLHHTFYGPDYEIEVRTDLEGYRLGGLGEVDYEKDLVLVCGDSYTFGWGVSTGETFPSYLDSLLDAASGGRQRVVNLGVGGYGLIQTCDRLATFVGNHREAHIGAMVVQHTVNDVVDNIANLGYHAGLWEVADEVKPRSRWHIVNLIAYAREILAARGARDLRLPDEPGAAGGEADTNAAYVQDLLWAFKRQGQNISWPASVSFRERRVELDSAAIKQGVDLTALTSRKRFSPAQRGLALTALDCIHNVSASLGVTAIHVFIATTPDWYADEMQELIKESAQVEGAHVVVRGAFPDADAFSGPVGTGHSGGHFNAPFNRYWAERTLDLLQDAPPAR